MKINQERKNDMEKEFLPLGSVVRLKNGTKRILICGRLQLRESDQCIFDYCACYYPEGILNPQELFLFQHCDIEEICFRGFSDEEEVRLLAYMKKRCEELDLKNPQLNR